jgi:hypothetical protein
MAWNLRKQAVMEPERTAWAAGGFQSSFWSGEREKSTGSPEFGGVEGGLAVAETLQSDRLQCSATVSGLGVGFRIAVVSDLHEWSLF